MGDDRDKQYREYLRMREKASKETTTFGNSQSEYLRKAPYGDSNYNQGASYSQQEAEYQREREKEAYLAARETQENPQGKKKNKGNGGNKKGKKKKKSAFKIIMLILLIFVLALGGLAGGAYAMVRSVLNNIGTVDVDTNNIGIDSDVDSELSNYRNIAILGIDSRDMDDDTDARSDSIIIASINKKTNEIKMFSVYRDTMLELGGDIGLDKITHAYYYGKAEGSLYALNRNLDMNIKEVVVVNWKAVADTIDAVGGVEIDVQDAEKDEMNKFIKETAKKTGLDEYDEITETGKQTLNGVQAVTYARIRKDAITGDYRRNERMKIVVKATFDKALENPSYEMIKKIATVVMPEIKTNIPSEDLLDLAIHLKDYKMNDTTTGWPYNVGEYVGAAWYGPPWTLYTNVVELHEKFFDQDDYVPTEDVQNISYNISYLTNLW